MQALSTSFCAFKCLIGHSVKERQRENSCLSQLFHRTHAWANSLFLEVDGVFCELFPNLRNGNRQPAKTTRGENEIKLVLPPLPLQQTFLFTSCFQMFLFCFVFLCENKRMDWNWGLGQAAKRTPRWWKLLAASDRSGSWYYHWERRTRYQGLCNQAPQNSLRFSFSLNPSVLFYNFDPSFAFPGKLDYCAMCLCLCMFTPGL